MDVYNVTNASGQTLSTSEVEEILKDIGISDDAIATGTEEAIEAYADENNIDLSKVESMAKEQGNDVSGSADTAKQDYEMQLKSLGIPYSVISKGNDAIQSYAAKNGITLPPANGTQLNVVS